MAYDDAVKKGALAFFDDKYGATVRMVNVPGVSKELCGGTHVNRTGDIGLIKITAESSVASGVRRIEAKTASGALASVLEDETELRSAAKALKASKTQVNEKIQIILTRQRALEKEIETLKKKAMTSGAGERMDEVREINGVKLLTAKSEETDSALLREMADSLRARLGSGIVVIGASSGEKAILLVAVTRDLTKKYNAGDIVKNLAPIIGGRGGGRAEMAQAGGSEGAKIDEALEKAAETLKNLNT